MLCMLHSYTKMNVVTALKFPADLVKQLPTGTVFPFMFLKPLITNNGTCQTAEKALTIILICVCGVFCVFSTFTDSCIKDGKTQYGIVTISGNLWPHSEKSNEYRLKSRDFGHALLALMVLGMLILLDTDTRNCLYPELISKAFLKWLPPVAGVVCKICAWFPHKRHGIGYHNLNCLIKEPVKPVDVNRVKETV